MLIKRPVLTDTVVVNNLHGHNQTNFLKQSFKTVQIIEVSIVYKHKHEKVINTHV